MVCTPPAESTEGIHGERVKGKAGLEKVSHKRACDTSPKSNTGLGPEEKPKGLGERRLGAERASGGQACDLRPS